MFSPTRVPLFMPYESVEEIDNRLKNTVILKDGRACQIIKANRPRNKFILTYLDSDDVQKTMDYIPDNGIDLAPPPAQYTVCGGLFPKGMWVFFPPQKGVYRQGRCSQNTRFTTYESGWGVAGSSSLPMHFIMKMMENPTPTVSFFSANDLILAGSSVVLSPHVAIATNIEKKLEVFYRGMLVAYVTKIDEKANVAYYDFVDEAYRANVWCRRRLSEVGLDLGE